MAATTSRPTGPAHPAGRGSTPGAPAPGAADGPRQGRGRRLLLGLVAGVAVAVTGYVGVSMLVADRLTKPYRRPLASSPAVFDLRYEDVTFASMVDGTTLRGWFLPVEASDRAVVIVHGRSSSRTGDNGELVAHAAALVDGGYNVLLFDFRAHGLSEGTRYTLGADEQGDVLGAVAYLEGRGFAPGRLGFWAHSMGAATVLLAAAASPDVRAIVADSSFARLDDLLARELPRESGLPRFFNPAILFFGRERYGLDTRILNPVEAVAGPAAPLAVHRPRRGGSVDSRGPRAAHRRRRRARRLRPLDLSRVQPRPGFGRRPRAVPGAGARVLRRDAQLNPPRRNTRGRRPDGPSGRKGAGRAAPPG